MTTAKTTEWHDTELSHQGLRILARMIARCHLEKEVARKPKKDTSAEVKSHSGRRIVKMDMNDHL